MIATMTRSVAYPIESVGNALRLIHLLRESGELRITDAARALGVAPSTAHRLMTMLVQYGFAQQNVRRTYQCGWAMPTAPEPSATETVAALAHPHLVELCRRLGETVHLVRREGTAAVFVDGAESGRRHDVHVTSRAGMVFLAHSTAAGKATLAWLEPAELAALFPRNLPRTYGPGPRDLPTLNRQLARIRRQGYSINDEESERGIIGIAVGVREGEGKAEWAVATGIPISRCPDERIATIVHELTITADRVRNCVQDPSWTRQHMTLSELEGGSLS